MKANEERRMFAEILWEIAMNKKSHIMITRTLSEKIPKKSRGWFLLGSILPDLLIHTYWKGHTWENSFGSICRKMSRLERDGKENRHSYLMAGYVLHYVEDYFTCAHNPMFQGNLISHIAYEKKLCASIQNEGWEVKTGNDYVMPLSATIEYLKQSHGEYLKTACSVETDMQYIRDAAQVTGNCLLHALQINSVEQTVSSIQSAKSPYVYGKAC